MTRGIDPVNSPRSGAAALEKVHADSSAVGHPHHLSHTHRGPMNSQMATHCVTFNGGVTFDLPRTTGDGGAARRVERFIGKLNGREHFSLLLFKLPEGKRLGSFNLKSFDMKDYVQVAAESQDRMTVEIRHSVENLILHETFGVALRVKGSHWTTIRWAEFETKVTENEVLNSSDVLEIFLEYMESGDVSRHKFKRRLLEL